MLARATKGEGKHSNELRKSLQTLHSEGYKEKNGIRADVRIRFSNCSGFGDGDVAIEGKFGK